SATRNRQQATGDRRHKFATTGQLPPDLYSPESAPAGLALEDTVKRLVSSVICVLFVSSALLVAQAPPTRPPAAKPPTAAPVRPPAGVKPPPPAVRPGKPPSP